MLLLLLPRAGAPTGRGGRRPEATRRLPLLAAAGVCASVVVMADGGAAVATAQEAPPQEAPAAAPPPAFDNPTLGTVPCIVLNRYDVAPAGRVGDEAQYRASASVENICGRTLDVEFCFLTAAQEGEAGRSCYGAALRPWTSAEVNAPGSAARVVGTDYRWKYR